MGKAHRHGRTSEAPQYHYQCTQGCHCMSARRTWFPLAPTSAPGGRAAVAAGAKKKGPIDPLTGPKQALAGRIVVMDDAFTVLPDGIVYIDQGNIIAVQKRAQPAPAGFA